MNGETRSLGIATPYVLESIDLSIAYSCIPTLSQTRKLSIESRSK